MFERFIKGARFVPQKTGPRGDGYGVAAPGLPHDERPETKSLILIHSDEELLYYLQRGYSVRMIAEDSGDGHLAKAEDVAVRFVPPYR